MVKQRTGDVLRSADRMLRVLEWFSEERPNGTAAEIARDLDVAPATVRRLLALLEAHRFIVRDPDSARYSIGFAAQRLASIARRTNPLSVVAQDELDLLERDVGELVILAVLDGVDVVHVDTRESRFDLRVHPAVGRRVRADEGGATGAVLLAWMADDRVRELVADEYSRVGARKRLVELQSALEVVRRQGYAVNDGAAFMEDVWGVAAPVRDSAGSTVAGLCVAAPAVRAGRERKRELITRTRASAAMISAKLGWSDDIEGLRRTRSRVPKR
jgi:DNA-binding IclR family transcriptional regulator